MVLMIIVQEHERQSSVTEQREAAAPVQPSAKQAGAPVVLMVHVPRQHEGEAGVPLLLHAHSCLKLGACLLQQGRGERSDRDLAVLPAGPKTAPSGSRLAQQAKSWLWG